MYASESERLPGDDAQYIAPRTSGGLLGFLDGAVRTYGTFQQTKAAFDDAKRTTTAGGNPTVPAPNVVKDAGEKPWTERPEVLIGLGILAFLIFKG